jgi:type I restriction enzyme S subunit
MSQIDESAANVFSDDCSTLSGMDSMITVHAEVPQGYRRTQIGTLPTDWHVCHIRELARIVRGASPRPIADPKWFDTHSDVGWLRIADLAAEGKYVCKTRQNLSELGIARSRLVEEGNLVMSMAATVGRPAISQTTICIHDGFVVFRSPIVPVEFFYYLLSSIESQWSERGQTGSQVNLNTHLIGSTEVPVPSDLEEQRTIAAALSDADALIERLDRLVAKRSAINQATMQQLLAGKIRLPGFEEEWETCRLGHVLSFQVGFPFKSEFFNSEGRGVRLVRNGDLKGDDIVLYYDGPYDSDFEINDGDVLVGMDGEFVPQKWRGGKALLNQRVGRIHGSSELDVRFAYYRLGEPLREIERATSGTTVKHLSHGDVARIEIPLPDVKEQSAIAEVLSDMDAEREALKRRRDKVRQIKQGMIQELLTGRTRLVEPSRRGTEEATA